MVCGRWRVSLIRRYEELVDFFGLINDLPIPAATSRYSKILDRLEFSIHARDVSRFTCLRNYLTTGFRSWQLLWEGAHRTIQTDVPNTTVDNYVRRTEWQTITNWSWYYVFFHSWLWEYRRSIFRTEGNWSVEPMAHLCLAELSEIAQSHDNPHRRACRPISSIPASPTFNIAAAG